MSSLGTSAVKESATAQFPLLEQQLRLLNANKVRIFFLNGLKRDALAGQVAERVPR